MTARHRQLHAGDALRPAPADPYATSRWLDIGGPVRYLDFGGRADDPLIVCVHGLGGSAVNWAAIAPLLTGSYRVLALDLAGHGLTRSGGRGTDVDSNMSLLHAFLGSVSADPVILMGNSMGGMIALLETSAAPERVSRLILVDPALPFVLARPSPLVASMFTLGAIPWLGRQVLGRAYRLRPETVVAGMLTLCCADPARVPADVVALHVALADQRAELPGVGRDIAVATRSVIATAASPGVPRADALGQLPGAGAARPPGPAGARVGCPLGSQGESVLVPRGPARRRTCPPAGGPAGERRHHRCLAARRPPPSGSAPGRGRASPAPAEVTRPGDPGLTTVAADGEKAHRQEVPATSGST